MMRCRCRKDPKTKVCPAWRSIRRQTIVSMHLEGMRLREIADIWDMNHIGSVINQLGDDYVYHHPPCNVRSVMGGEKIYRPLSACLKDGHAISGVYRALTTGNAYHGVKWRYVQ